ncbi:MAG: hypothetical protein ACFE9T_08445 [Promethearchaeota archaeon]
MIVDSENYNEYIGPRAIFDPNYIPPQLLYREKEVQTLYSILDDSIADQFCLNILYQGIQGIGKKVVVNKVLKDLLNKNKETVNIHKISIDCKGKNLEDIIFSILTELNRFSSFKIDFNSILNSKISHLWNIIKLASKKINCDLILLFYNIESLKPDDFKKFLQFGKESNITLISTVNKVLKPSTLDLLCEFDLKKKLNFFTYNELYSILKQRVSLTFTHEIDKELIRYITDLICEHYVPVPGKGIEILRDTYPLLIENKNLKNYEIIDICQNEFESIQVTDEFCILNYVSEEDLLTIIFLDNLSNYFLKRLKFYISLEELNEIYDISCESLEYEKNLNEFSELLKKLFNFGILSGSKRNLSKEKPYLLNNVSHYKSFFMVLNPKHLKAIVDAIFNK